MGETPQIQVYQACSVIAAKGASTKYWVKGLNTLLIVYINVIFQFKKCYTFAKLSKNPFLLCHHGVLCVEWWRKENNWINFRIRL
jgi:hypothetical protein